MATSAALLHDANGAAETIVKGWIRKVFRETSLQTLRQQWKVVNDENTLEISESMLLECHQVCERLAVHWEKRLHDSGQVQASQWVREVASGGQFWQIKGDTEERPEATPTSTTEEQQAERQDSPEGSPPQSEEPPFVEEKLPLAKLRKMYKNPNLAEWKTILDQLGRSGQTQWPHDWQLIEEYCQTDMVDRLYAKRVKRVQFEVVPKELASSVEHQDECAIQSTRLQALLDRKRKADEEEPSLRTTRRRTVDHDISEEARPPSDHPELVVWDWEAEKKTIEDQQQQLEADFLHSDIELDPPNTILGALRPVGHTYYHQTGSDVSEMTDKQQRRALKASVKQRLHGAEVLRDERKAPTTKVVRTKSRNQGGYSMDLDVGEGLLEMDGKLYAFSCLEVSLKDEDG